MFQVLLQYFEDRFVSLYVDEPLSNYHDLLDYVKTKLYRFFKALTTSKSQYHTNIFRCKHLSILTAMTFHMSPKPFGTLRLADQTFTDDSV